MNNLTYFIFIRIFVQISLNILIPVQVLFCQFLEEYNRYNDEIFSVH